MQWASKELTGLLAVSLLLAGCGNGTPAVSPEAGLQGETVADTPGPGGGTPVVGQPVPTPVPTADAPPLDFEFVTVRGLTEPNQTLSIAPATPGRSFDEPVPDPVRGITEGTTLYDIEDGRAIDLGPGTNGSFSPDSRHMTWATWSAGPGTLDQVWVIDLQTLEKRFLGQGMWPSFWNNETIRVTGYLDPSRPTGEPETILIDIESGRREARDGRGDSVRVPSEYYRAELSDAELSGDESTGYIVHELSSGRGLFRFEAGTARAIDADTILVTSHGIPVDPPPATSDNGEWLEHSIYLITVSSQEVSYVATLVGPACFTLTDATGDFVAWRRITGSDDDQVLVFDRRTETISGLGEDFPPIFASNGMLTAGPVGIPFLIDLTVPEYYAKLPSGHFSYHWSPDYKFASTGFIPAHGTGC